MLTCDEPAEDEQGRQRVPGGADRAQHVGLALFGRLGTGQTGKNRKNQPKDPPNDQVDGDVGLAGALVQVYCPWWTEEGTQEVIDFLTFLFLDVLLLLKSEKFKAL